ncbi:MAG: DNA-deoxyinosine glycosylase [Oscillospiraceae bacterium]|nr:DNA-deoxyinosine glycosylase [Oscillospiraceae bacterium]
MVTHPIDPVFDNRSKILILGSFPSVKSRETDFFYGHPQNRFWKVLSAVLNSPEPISVEEKRHFLLNHRIALWDVIASCEITSSADSSIKNASANDLTPIFTAADIRRVYLNGKTAQRYFDRLLSCSCAVEAICLPSTSPANAAWSLTRLTESWAIIRQDLNE